MVQLNTKYLGLNLKNPIVVSSSGLSNTVEKVQKLEESGAAAIVLKSLFEEQIRYESGSMEDMSNYPEASDYILSYTKSNTVEQYLKLIEGSKKYTDIPIIPSINCVSSKEWVDFARDVESAGADALELNVYFLPTDKTKSSGDYEKLYLNTIQHVIDKVSIPVAVKLGRNFTNPAYMVDQIYNRGAKGVILFNRFYEPDIDVKNMKIVSSEVLSTPADIRQSLRWIGIISSLDIKLDIAASTGVFDGNDAVKEILAGASVAMVCSALYKYGVEHIESMLEEMVAWMKSNNYETIKEFQGKMSYRGIPDPAMYERSQFMKYFSSIQ